MHEKKIRTTQDEKLQQQVWRKKFGRIIRSWGKSGDVADKEGKEGTR